jgi:hypothetical protein
MRKIFTQAMFLFAFSLVSSCALIIHGTKQEVAISSNPSAAKINIDGQYVGNTPLATRLTRYEHHLVKIELPGYLPYEAIFTRKVDGWIAGNLVFGGLVGLVLDVATGAMYKLTPNQIAGDLKNGATAVKTSKDGIVVAVVLNADPGWQKIGQLTKDGGANP